MQVVILGVGAMGCLFASRLSPLVGTVMIGTWPEQLEALRAGDLTVIQPDGQRHQVTVRVTNEVTAAGTADLVLVLVKSWQTERAAGQAAQLLNQGLGLALTLQNGLGNLDKLASVTGRGRAALGTTSEGATIVEPGLVRHAGHGRTYLAATPETAGRLAMVATLLTEADFDVELVENANSLMWGKVAVNAGINPLTALLQVQNGFLAQHEATREIMFQAAREAAAVAEAQGISLPFVDAGQQALAVAEATAGNLSSMAQDIARRAPTEIEAICGQIVAQGRQWRVATPVNQMLLNLIEALEIRNRDQAIKT